MERPLCKDRPESFFCAKEADPVVGDEEERLYELHDDDQGVALQMQGGGTDGFEFCSVRRGHDCGLCGPLAAAMLGVAQIAPLLGQQR